VGCRLVVAESMLAIHSVESALTGRFVIRVFQTFVDGNMGQFGAPGTGVPADETVVVMNETVATTGHTTRAMPPSTRSRRRVLIPASFTERSIRASHRADKTHSTISLNFRPEHPEWPTRSTDGPERAGGDEGREGSLGLDKLNVSAWRPSWLTSCSALDPTSASSELIRDSVQLAARWRLPRSEHCTHPHNTTRWSSMWRI
jgi:hypothetical protein